jgi:hypothetical protein
MPTDEKMEDKLFVFCAVAASGVFLSHGPDSRKTSARGGGWWQARQKSKTVAQDKPQHDSTAES